MDSFLDFITDNYTYFLIAAGVLTLALIGLLVSGRNKKKKGENVEVVETAVDNKTISEVPKEDVKETIVTSAPEELKIPEANVVNTPIAPVSETIDLNKTVEASPMPEVTPVTPIPVVPTTPTATTSIPPTAPMGSAPDEPIVNINPTQSNTFELNQNQNNNTTPGNGQ